MYGFHRKLIYFIMLVITTLALTNTLAFYKTRTLRISNVFIEQAPVANDVKLLMAVNYECSE